MRRPSITVITLVLGACIAAAALGGPAATFGARTHEDPPSGIAPGTAFAAFEAQVLTRPQAVLATDGKRHIAYELVLTGSTSASLKVTRVKVRDADSKRTLLTLSGKALASHLTTIGDTETPLKGSIVGGSESAVLWLDVRLPARGPRPARLDHVVTGVVQVKGGKGPAVTSVLTPVRTDRSAPLVLGPPVGGGGRWFASDGCCNDYTHHRWGMLSVNGDLQVPQRFAIDWYVLDEQHRSWVGDPSKLSNYLTYGRPVIAAADGVVVAARDGISETTSAPNPPPIPPIDQTVGNNVILRVAPGLFLLHGHMQPGSVRVRRGQRVKRGDVLGLIGSSGNSSTPHLHFQVDTTPTFFPTDSVPYVFDRFDLVGQITERIWDDDLGLQPTPVLPFAPARDPGPRRNEMPLDRNVIVFPAS
jgi:hypothetical protein